MLLVACLTGWRRRLSGSGFASAFAVQLGWSLVLIAQLASVRVDFSVFAATEYLRSLAWMIVLARCLSASGNGERARTALRAISFVTAIVVLGEILIQVEGAPLAITGYLSRHWLWGGLLLSIAGMVLVEQVARNTRAGQRWNLKYVWLAIGAMYTWDLCVYSTAMLGGSTAPTLWLVRGFVSALTGCLLAVGLRRVTIWHASAFLSARLIFFNAVLLGAALYVIGMAVASYMLRELGQSWGAAGQAVFLVGSALVIVIAVLSEQFRAWMRVTLAKHLFPYKYDYRAEWQKLTRALSQAADTSRYERVSAVLAQSVHCGCGGLWLRDAEDVFRPVGGDLASVEGPSEPAAQEFFEYLREHDWICDLEDARAPRTGDVRRTTPPPPAWMLNNPKMWLVVPLICEHALVGFVVLGQPLAPVRLSWEEIDLLHAAGRQVASFLAFELAAKRLAEAHQFDALNRVSAFLMHDLRHLIAQQALVVENAARHRGNPEFFDDAILTIDNSVKRMSRLMDELRYGVAEQTQRVELAELSAEVVRRCAQRKPAPALDVRERRVEVVLNRERMLTVLEQVVRNAQDATAADGTVSVGVNKTSQQAVIDIVDTGTGMDKEFIRNRLFRPFDTTKGAQGLGIGAYEARDFVRKCGGNVEVESTRGRGTRFTIRLPLAPSLGAPETSVREFQAR